MSTDLQNWLAKLANYRVLGLDFVDMELPQWGAHGVVAEIAANTDVTLPSQIWLSENGYSTGTWLIPAFNNTWTISDDLYKRWVYETADAYLTHGYKPDRVVVGSYLNLGPSFNCLIEMIDGLYNKFNIIPQRASITVNKRVQQLEAEKERLQQALLALTIEHQELKNGRVGMARTVGAAGTRGRH